MRHTTPSGFVEDLVDRLIHPGCYYEGAGPTMFLLYADSTEHLTALWTELRIAIDDSGVHYTAKQSGKQFRIVDPIEGKAFATINCSHLQREDVVTPMRGCSLDDVFICASDEMCARKINDDFLMAIMPVLYNGAGTLRSTFVNRVQRGDFNMNSHVDTVHTNKQRIEKLRTTLNAAGILLEQEGADSISTAEAYTALRYASEEAMPSLNALEQYIDDVGDLEEK